MRAPRLKKLLTIACLLAIAVAFLPGCTAPAVMLPTALSDFSLTGMWDAFVQESGISEDTARLGEFNIRVDANGDIFSMYGSVTGYDSRGRMRLYFLSSNPAGKLTWSAEYREGQPPQTLSPRQIFSAIDAYGLTSVAPGKGGLFVLVDFISGSIGYSRDYTDIFELAAGELVPLKAVHMQSPQPWCTVSVYQMEAHDTTAATLSQTVVMPVPPSERTSQVWFLSQDMGKAKTATYLG